MTLIPCKKYGCGSVVSILDGYCAKHKRHGKSRELLQKEKSTVSFYNSAKWRLFAKNYKQLNPLCEKCLQIGKTTTTYCVDHIIEIKDGGDLTTDDNAMSLCRSCHSKKTAKEKTKRGRAG